MKQDRLSALRQRLKRGSFEFGALLEGVSTLEESAPEAKDARGKTQDASPDPGSAGVTPAAVAPTVPLNGTVEHAAPVLEVELLEVEVVEDVISDAVTDDGRQTTDDALPSQPLLPLLEDAARLNPQPSTLNPQSDGLRAALDALGCRFLQEVGSFRAAVAERDVEEGGFHLAHLNQVLELLHDIDPDGEMARQLHTMAAPPPGRSWPSASWTVVEFAASPFSALLPSKADEAFARDLLYAAWGVRFEAVE